MAFNEQGFRQAAVQQGFSPEQVESYVKQRKSEEKAKSRTGLSKWLFGERTSIPGMAVEAVGNVLNVPSYAVGGVLNNFQRMGGSKYAQGQQVQPLGFIEGVKNKRAVMSELPETFGIDPNSAAGMAIGFGGELLTPDLFMGADLAKGLSFARKGTKASPGLFTRVIQKAGEGIEEGGKGLAVRALKPSPSQVKKFEQTSGMSLGDFISQNNLYGTGRKALEKVEPLIAEQQKVYNSLARSGKLIDPKEYVQSLLKRADEITKNDFSYEAQRVAEGLRGRAKIFQDNATKFKGGIPIEVLTNTKSGAFGSVPGGAMIDPNIYHAGKIAGEEGIKLLDSYAPGSAKVGRNLQALREFRDIASKQRGLGEGSQVFNMFKPSAGGAVVGGMFGGIPGAAAGAALSTIGNNPKTLSAAATGGQLIGRGVQRAAPQIARGTTRMATTAGRVAIQPNQTQQRRSAAPLAPTATRRNTNQVSQQQQDRELVVEQTPPPIISANRPSRMENPYKKLRLRS